MGKPLRLLHVSALVLLLYGVTLIQGAPRVKRQAQAYLSWFYKNFPWYAPKPKTATKNDTSTTTNSASKAKAPQMPAATEMRRGPVMTPPRSTPMRTQSAFNSPGQSIWQQQNYGRYNFNYGRLANPPVRAYNLPGINVRGPLIPQRQATNGVGFANRGPLLTNSQTGGLPRATNPAVDPADPPDMINGVPVTEAPEVPEPPDPTDPPEVPLYPGAGGNAQMFPRQNFAAGLPNYQGGFGPMGFGPPVEPTDPPDVTDPPEIPEFGLGAAVSNSPTTAAPPSTLAPFVLPNTFPTSTTQQATPPRVTDIGIPPTNTQTLITQMIGPNQVPALNQVPVQPSIMNRAQAQPAVLSQAPVQPSIMNQAPVQPSIMNQAPVRPSIMNQAPVQPSIMNQAPVRPSIMNQAPAQPSIMNQAPIMPAIESQAPYFQQAPPFIGNFPPSTPRMTTARFMEPPVDAVRPGMGTTGQNQPSGAQQSVVSEAQSTSSSAQNNATAITQSSPKSAPPAGEQSSPWVMGANFSNMPPWRRMLWNRYFLGSL